MKKALLTVLSLFLFPLLAFGGEGNFIDEWKFFLDYGNYGKKHTDYESVTSRFNKQAREQEISIGKESNKKYLVYNLAFFENQGLQLYIPYAPDDIHEIYNQCTKNRGYLKYRGAYTKLPINPLCSETSSLDDLDITFHFVKKGEFPFVSISTNGPACIPSWLYKYELKNNTFKLVAEACGG